jgi:hypothetical protein
VAVSPGPEEEVEEEEEEEEEVVVVVVGSHPLPCVVAANPKRQSGRGCDCS